jgi:hypothetical protein
MEFEYTRQERKLVEILKGKRHSAQEAVDVLDYLIRLGIEDVVAGMVSYFEPCTIVDFVALSRLYGGGKKLQLLRTNPV